MQEKNDTTQVKNGAIQAVIFDLDGVLMDSEWLFFQVWRELVALRGGNLDERHFPDLIGITVDETVERVMQLTGLRLDAAESVDWVWRRVSEKLKGAVEPLPGAVELVRALAARGYPLAVASNSITSYIDDALEGLKLDGDIIVRVGADQVAEGKPAPDVYLLAAARLGVAPQDCLAVEDSRVGVRAAAAAGMRVVAIPGAHNHHDGYHQAWRVYDSLLDVGAALDEILA